MKGDILRMATSTGGRKPTFLFVPACGRQACLRNQAGEIDPGAVVAGAKMVDVEKVRGLVERVVTSEGLALVDVELKGRGANQILKVYIDRAGGVTHADCQTVSEQLSAHLDVEDMFPGPYVLEVSSPGLDRSLVKPTDYLHFAGRRARLVLREPLGDQKVVEGRLAGYEAGRVRLDLGSEGVHELELSNISKAKLIVEL